MPQYELPVSNVADWNDLDAFTRGYIEAMFFCECNSDNPELEDMETGDIAPDTLAHIVEDCKAWQELNAALLALAYERDNYSEEQAGRDYWFTRNGHGVGFWDRKQLEQDGLGDTLSKAAGRRECYVYRGDDNLLHVG